VVATILCVGVADLNHKIRVGYLLAEHATSKKHVAISLLVRLFVSDQPTE